ncbi:MAG: hypothetical protein H8E37_05680 [Planctomycetes bacterium]|nr:hypothetical protein [Planctomycetota bacterium]
MNAISRTPSLPRRMLPALTVLVLLTSASGCSLFVMFGKMLLGDPTVEAPFKQRTSVDLTDGEAKILVVCKTPSLVLSKLPTLQYDLNEGVLRRLKQHGISTVSPDEVSDWLDENGGEFTHPRELAEDFDCDFIVVATVRELGFREPNSPNMYRGRANGGLRVFEVKEVDGQRDALQIYTSQFNTEYPRMNPVPTTQVGERVFQKQFMTHLTDTISRQFYDYRAGEDF